MTTLEMQLATLRAMAPAAVSRIGQIAATVGTAAEVPEKAERERKPAGAMAGARAGAAKVEGCHRISRNGGRGAGALGDELATLLRAKLLHATPMGAREIQAKPGGSAASVRQLTRVGACREKLGGRRRRQYIRGTGPWCLTPA